MALACQQTEVVTYRNFNLCPHCAHWGRDAFLCRLCESMPMISRSDGTTYHLVLADRPLSYPAEAEFASTQKLSVCFWYSHSRRGKHNDATIVILPHPGRKSSNLFRLIETVADLLADELLHSTRLAAMYEFSNDSLSPITF